MHARLMSRKPAPMAARGVLRLRRCLRLDAFGNALGSSLAGSMQSPGQQAAPALQGGGPWSDVNYRNGMDVDSDRVTNLNGFLGAFDQDYSGSRYPGEQIAGGGNVLRLSDVRSDADDLDGQLADAQAMLRSLDRADAARAVAAQRATSRALDNMQEMADAYRASGMKGATGDPFVFESSIVAGQGLKGPSDGFWRGLSGEGRSVLEGSASFGENLGLTVNGLVTGPVRAAYSFASEIGNQYADAYNLLTPDGASYVPSSALASSLQRNGIGSTLASMGQSMLSSPTKPIFDLLEGNYRAAGEGLLGTAAMGMGVVRSIGLKAPSFGGDVITLNGATRTTPLGFSGSTQFLDATGDLHAALQASGINDAVVGVRGSAVTGYSITKGTKFGPQSDIDFFVESEQLTSGYKPSKNIPGFIHPNKILPDYPLLNDWANRWTNTLGRDVTPGAFRPGTLPTQPAIVIKKWPQ